MQNVSIQMVEALKRRRDVELETIILRAPWERIGISTTFFLFRLLWLIPKAVKKFDPDVILFSSMVTAGVLPFLSRKVNVPKVTINHGQDVTLPVWIYQKYLSFVFRQLDGVISVSKATHLASVERGMKTDKGVVLPNGFDSRAKLLPDRDVAIKRLEREFGIDFTTLPTLLTVGRQVRRKGHARFIRDILPKIRTDVNYIIVGDGPEFETIRREIEKSEWPERVCLTGRQPEEILRCCYAAADLFVMPNIPVDGDMEGFGIVLLEANQAGVPAIASDLEGIRDVIEQGVNGYRVPYDQPDEFASKIDAVLNNDLEKLSVSSREYVEENFSWDRVVTRYLDYLNSVISS